MSFGDEHDPGGHPARPDDGFGGSGQTRTRLPDQRAGDGLGGGRRPARVSRSLVTVVGVVVLLVAAIAFANRGGGGDSSTSNGRSGAGAATDPTAPSGVKPVTGKGGPDSSIPSGFAMTQQGASSAAANYAVALGSAGMFTTSTRHAIVDDVYTPNASAQLQRKLDAAYTPAFLTNLGLDANGQAPQGSTFISRTIPVGTKVESFATDKATVSVWYTGLIGMAGSNSTNPVSTTWKTGTFDFQWVGGDWKIATYTQTNGPAPVPGDDTAATSDQITKAVQQFGGFTYAR